MNIPILIARVSLLGILASPLLAQTNVFPSSGNVGIGTTTPNQPLEIAKTGNAVVTVRQLDAPAAGKYAQITLSQGPTYFGANDKSWQVVSNGLSTGEADLVFQYWNGTSYTEAARMTGSGNVGVGTNAPRSRFDIGGSLGAGKGARFGDYLEINEREAVNNASSLGWNAYIAANDGTYAPVYEPGTGMVLTMAGGGVGDLDFYGKNWGGSTTPQNLSTFTHVLRLSTNGNVGIGTNAPVALLHTKGGAVKIENGIVTFPAISNGLATGEIHGGGASGADAGFLRLSAGGESTANAKAGIDIGGYTTGDPANGYGAVRIWGGNTSGAPTEIARFINGNVGIGTTNPTQKLSVNGTIRAKEVIVDTGWSDFVFADDYRLAPLSEIETQIKADGHLPGIPSAQDIAEHGVSMGEMQAKLLAKIEELTLHAIAQEKALLAQQQEFSTRLARLEQENAALRRTP